MIIIIILFTSVLIGLVFSWGPDALSLFLSSVGSFDRLSWFSLVGTGIVAGYWIVLCFRMYRHANAEIVYEEDETEETEIPDKIPKFGKKALIFGVVLTIAWIALFISTDQSALAADSFAAWRTENANMLQFVQKIGHLLLAFAAGIGVSLFHRSRRTRKKSTKGSNGNTGSGSTGQN